MRAKDNKITLPNLVRILCWNHDAYIVGSTVDKLINQDNSINDWDIIVPTYQWNKARFLIPKGTPANNFGGFKVNENGVEIDVWADNIEQFIETQITQNKEVKLLQPKYHILINGSNLKRTWH